VTKVARMYELDGTISEYPVEEIHSYGVEFRFAKRSHVIIPWHRIIDVSWMDESLKT
jgi:uncharacterized protein (UPF0248 family)